MDDSLSAYMDVLLESNVKIAEEYYSMNKNRVALKQVVERLGLTKEWEARGEARARAEVAAELERLRREVARLKALV
jgi:predicted metal-dependent HD superfamily phosphohydrolase